MVQATLVVPIGQSEPLDGPGATALLRWGEQERPAARAALATLHRGELWVEGPLAALGDVHAWAEEMGLRAPTILIKWDDNLPNITTAELAPERRVLSWSTETSDPRALREGLEAMLATPARWYRVITTRTDAALHLLCVARALGRQDVCVYTQGPDSAATRVLSAALAAPLVFCDDEPALQRTRLRRDYGLPRIPRPERLCAIVGPRVTESLSPCLHNAMYRDHELPWLFLPFVTDDLERFLQEVGEALPVPLGGLTVTGALKGGAASLACASSPQARRARSANLLLRGEAGWSASSVDAELADGMVAAGEILEGQTALVVGCGGSGRAIALALAERGVRVRLSNRTPARGEEAARALGLPFSPLCELDLRSADIVVNATSVGSTSEDLPFSLEGLREATLVVDLVCAPRPTALAREASRRGAAVLDGWEVLRRQVRRHFEAMTGLCAPIDQALGGIRALGAAQ